MAERAVDYPKAIAARWHGAAKAILEAGRLLIEAKGALEHGRFRKMIEGQLPFGARTAERLMKIAADPRLSKATHASLLPPSWTTLYELSQVPEDLFAKALADGRINPEMGRSDAQGLLNQARRATRTARILEDAAPVAMLPEPVNPDGGPQSGTAVAVNEDMTECHVALAGDLDTIAAARRFPIILADPPWRLPRAMGDTDRSIENHYPTMTLAEIAALPLGDLATPAALLAMWVTVPLRYHVQPIFEGWGFTYVSSWGWHKPAAGMGYWGRENYEDLILCKRGDFPPPAPSDVPPAVFDAPAGAHSAKPAEIHDRLERAWPELPKIELFARLRSDAPPRPGWAYWGNQAVGDSLSEAAGAARADRAPARSGGLGGADVSNGPDRACAPDGASPNQEEPAHG